jgi:hypothetical protein
MDCSQVSPFSIFSLFGSSDSMFLSEMKNDTDDSYPLPPSCEDTEILRVVIRESLSGDLARKLLADIIQV